MSENFLIVDKRIVPSYYDKVVRARRLLESQKCKSVNEAVEQVGISRSTYYKYKDSVFLPSEHEKGHRFTISIKLDDTPGLLSKVLQCVSTHDASIITIHQDVPINNSALVVMTLNSVDMPSPVEAFMGALLEIEGVNDVTLMAIE